MFIDWYESYMLVKVVFFIYVFVVEMMVEIQFGYVCCLIYCNMLWDQVCFEIVMYCWVDMLELDFGVVFFNDCKYGYDVKEGVVCLMLLCFFIYLWVEVDQGEYCFCYVIYVYYGLFVGEGVLVVVESFNVFLCFYMGSGEGLFQKVVLLFGLEGSGVVVESVKKVESNDDLIVCFWEIYGCCVSVWFVLLVVVIGVFEVDFFEWDVWLIVQVG